LANKLQIGHLVIKTTKSTHFTSLIAVRNIRIRTSIFSIKYAGWLKKVGKMSKNAQKFAKIRRKLANFTVPETATVNIYGYDFNYNPQDRWEYMEGIGG